jgi:hypothetical protein
VREGVVSAGLEQLGTEDVEVWIDLTKLASVDRHPALAFGHGLCGGARPTILGGARAGTHKAGIVMPVFDHFGPHVL